MAFSLKRHRASIAYNLLKEITLRGGMTFKECQAFAFANRRRAHLFSELGRTMPRGWWCDALVGTHWRPGILRTHCVLDANKRYQVVESLDTPFWHTTPVYVENEAKSEAARKARDEAKPKCVGCGLPLQEVTSDAQAHITCWSTVYKIDCLGRVWLCPEGWCDSTSSLSYDRLTTVQGNADPEWLKVAYDRKEDVIRAYLSSRLA